MLTTMSMQEFSKDDTNKSVHWTHQYVMEEKITNPMDESSKPQKSVSDLQLIELLPSKNVQENLTWQWSILVSRVITTYLKPFQQFAQEVIRHITHIYSKEMERKSKILSTVWIWNIVGQNLGVDETDW